MMLGFILVSSVVSLVEASQVIRELSTIFYNEFGVLADNKLLRCLDFDSLFGFLVAMAVIRLMPNLLWEDRDTGSKRHRPIA